MRGARAEEHESKVASPQSLCAARPLELAPSPAGALLAPLGSGETEPDDRGYLEFQDPSEGRIAELEAHLEKRRLPSSRSCSA
jgi:hypothetical protein